MQGGFGVLTRFHLAAGKLPHTRKPRGRTAPGGEQPGGLLKTIDNGGGSNNTNSHAPQPASSRSPDRITEDGGVRRTEIWQELSERLRLHAPWPELGITSAEMLAAIGAGLLLVIVPGVWRMVRVGVTVVHELGHGVVGRLVGRKFRGFVLRPDMSGHALTHGPARGIGIVLTTWAGYPAPGVVGAVMLHAAASGWAPRLLAGITVVMALGLIRARSIYTVAVLILIGAGSALAWYFAPAAWQVFALSTVGTMLLVGAWRHALTVALRPSPGSDPRQLARLTGVPSLAWSVSFLVVLGLVTWWAMTPLRPLVA